MKVGRRLIGVGYWRMVCIEDEDKEGKLKFLWELLCLMVCF